LTRGSTSFSASKKEIDVDGRVKPGQGDLKGDSIWPDIALAHTCAVRHAFRWLMKERADTVNRRIALYRRYLAEGVDADFART
jgi:hypothetical protein